MFIVATGGLPVAPISPLVNSQGSARIIVLRNVPIVLRTVQRRADAAIGSVRFGENALMRELQNRLQSHRTRDRGSLGLRTRLLTLGATFVLLSASFFGWVAPAAGDPGDPSLLEASETVDR